MHRRFVIVSAARSGSSLLTATLDLHPRILCHGEIFHAKIDRHVRADALAATGAALRDADPLGFALGILAFREGEHAVGFKMWRLQSPDVCDALLADPDVLKIILERQNGLAAYSSAQLAKRSGVWNLGVRPRPDMLASARSARSRFDADEFLRFLARRDAMFEQYREAARGPVLDITYTALAGPGGFEPVFDFLGVKRMRTPQQKSRIHSADILDRFEPRARADAETALHRLGRLDWAYEPIG